MKNLKHKKVPKPGAVQAVLMEVEAKTVTMGAVENVVEKETRYISAIPLGINHGDFSAYIARGRGNNITWPEK